jgi:DNA-binding transcriptional MerR regulator
MEYSVSELAFAAGITVDTVRYYQGLGLLPSPRHRGRKAVYESEHVERLESIRALAASGLSLKVIARIVSGDVSKGPDRALLQAIEAQVETPSFSSKELAEKLGIPHALLASVAKSGLAQAQVDETGTGRYTRADLDAARKAMSLLEHGFPLSKLMALALGYDRAVRKASDDAIDLFDDYVRKGEGGIEDEGSQEVADAFKELLPVVTSLVAYHFQRVLVNKALKRLKKSGERSSLRRALEVAGKNRLELKWQ